ncbi:RNA polymerase sigma factor [Flagellimonas algicola]|uniref:RNA polymerase sigma factor n=1 Tax=Flagellimonas algicola TaxID=2583815 RepID=A0ABY2WQY9_9FLAO|nr:RNA polymerase sigma factor [Allomuricauda algicola]TMU57353.1 RNA polymerase sigma factor [Allomuricauda algicola]
MAAGQENNKEDKYLEQAARGDREGLEYLVNAYKDLAYAIAIKVLQNKEDAEEVVQDSFIRAFASLKKFKKSSKFSTWLYRIVYNNALTKIEKRKRELSYTENHYKDEIHFETLNKGWEELLQAEKLRYLDLAMNKLSREDHLIFFLHYTEGKTITEIKGILGLKKSAIKMRLSRGRKLLKEQLKLLLGNETKELL